MIDRIPSWGARAVNNGHRVSVALMLARRPCMWCSGSVAPRDCCRVLLPHLSPVVIGSIGRVDDSLVVAAHGRSGGSCCHRCGRVSTRVRSRVNGFCCDRHNDDEVPVTTAGWPDTIVRFALRSQRRCRYGLTPARDILDLTIALTAEAFPSLSFEFAVVMPEDEIDSNGTSQHQGNESDNENDLPPVVIRSAAGSARPDKAQVRQMVLQGALPPLHGSFYQTWVL